MLAFFTTMSKPIICDKLLRGPTGSRLRVASIINSFTTCLWIPLGEHLHVSICVCVGVEGAFELHELQFDSTFKAGGALSTQPGGQVAIARAVVVEWSTMAERERGAFGEEEMKVGGGAGGLDRANIITRLCTTRGSTLRLNSKITMFLLV